MQNRFVLVPLDGSALAETAIPYAVTLARAYGVALELVAATSGVDLEAIDGRLTSTETEDVRAYLTAVADGVRRQGLACVTAERAGDPVEVILNRARDPLLLAIVMATRGQGAVERAVVGSVADAVRRGSPVPVFLIGPAPDRSPATPWMARRLLVPLDESARAEAALGPARDLAIRLDAEIVLAHVEPWLSAHVVRDALRRRDITGVEREITLAAADYLREVRVQEMAGCRTHTVVLRGAPAKRLPAFARAERIDLVVMTSHAHSGLRRLMQRSLTDVLLWKGLPVCVVPAPTELRPATQERLAAPNGA